MEKIIIFIFLLFSIIINNGYAEDYSFVRSGAEFNITDNSNNPVKLYAYIKKDETVVFHNLSKDNITLACHINDIYGVNTIKFTAKEDNLYMLLCSKIYGDITINKTVIIGCFTEDSYNSLFNK